MTCRGSIWRRFGEEGRSSAQTAIEPVKRESAIEEAVILSGPWQRKLAEQRVRGSASSRIG